MISIFQKIFDLISSEEFCFLYVEPARDGYGISPSLSPLSSPPLPSPSLTVLQHDFCERIDHWREEKCSLTEGRLLIYPVSNFKTVTILSRYLFSPSPPPLLSPLLSLLDALHPFYPPPTNTIYRMRLCFQKELQNKDILWSAHKQQRTGNITFTHFHPPFLHTYIYIIYI